MTVQFVAYFRVSTAKQGSSGLGLEAQRRAVEDYVTSRGGELIGTFSEVESGKRQDRPELARAMERCRITGAILVIAKLDRLSRNVHFLSGLMEQRVRFVACDMPDANNLTVHIMAAVAQQEREAISARTKAALGAIKLKLSSNEAYIAHRSGKRVTRLGNPNGLKIRRPDLGAAAKRANADAFALDVLPTIRELEAGGATSLAAIAAGLNDLRVLTPRGRAWTPMAVKRVRDRAGGLRADAA